MTPSARTERARLASADDDVGVELQGRADAEAVLLTGVYGAGKTSMVEEIAEILEHRGVRYGAIDLDWLAWYDPGSSDHVPNDPVVLKNVDAVVGNYYDAGVRRFAVAGSVGSTSEVEGLRAALAMPLTVVLLRVPIEEVERRLRTSVTTGRQDDLRRAKEWLAEGRGQDLGDHTVESGGSIHEAARHVVSILGW